MSWRVVTSGAGPVTIWVLFPAMQQPESIPWRDPEVRPPEYRVPRGRSGVGAAAALATLLADLERIRRAKEAYGDVPRRSFNSQHLSF